MYNKGRCANSTPFRDTGVAVSVFVIKVAACLEANQPNWGTESK